jgi:acyl-CoA synthetase (AMP-forming)/AMP-acid ligase II
VYETVGRPTVGVVVHVVDDHGNDLPCDGASAGELVVASEALARGYWNKPGESAQSFTDGWYRTGDIGTIDPAGYVRILDRRTDLIVSGGMNVYATEVEECIREAPGVADVGVVGVPDEKWGTAVLAVVVRSPGSTATGESIVAHCREKLASYKKPRYVEFVEQLPRTTSLKVARGELRAEWTRRYTAHA